MAPVNPSAAQREVTSTPLLPPYGRGERNRSVCMFLDTPTRADGLQEIEIYDVLAAARADHRRRPQVLTFAT